MEDGWGCAGHHLFLLHSSLPGSKGWSCKLPWVCPQVKDVVEPMPSPELDAAKHQQGAGCDAKTWGHVCCQGEFTLCTQQCAARWGRSK